MFTIRSGGPPHIYHFTKCGASSPNAADDKIEGPSISYTLAYPVNNNIAGQAEYSLELHQEGRDGPVKIVLTFSSSPSVDAFKLKVPDRDYEVLIRPNESFEGPYGRRQFCWMKGGPLVKRQFACWEIDPEGHEGKKGTLKTKRKAAKWKLGYETGLGIAMVNQDFSGEREILLASAIGISIVKQHKSAPKGA
ncbi:hypothetical protein JCM11251_006693 [Rhodosporidiobolus azoricus]